MEERNVELREGLAKLHTSQVLVAVAMVLMCIPFVNIVALILALVGAVMALIAIVKLNHLHPDYEMALTFVVVGIILSIVESFANGGLETIASLFSSVASFAQTFYIIKGTNSLLENVGRMDVVEAGRMALKLYVASVVTSVVVSLLTVVLGETGLGLALMVLIVSLAVSIAAMVYYIKYLGSAKDCF